MEEGTKKEEPLEQEDKTVEQRENMVEHKEKEVINQEEIQLKEEQLEKIEEERNKQKAILEDRIKKINQKLFQNIMIAIVVILYFIFINLGFSNIEYSVYLTDLKAFSMTSIGITILLFEKAYKKDSLELTIYGIEALLFSIITLVSTYFSKVYPDKFCYMMNAISFLFAIYYVVKATIIYIKMKKKALKRVSDIHKIGRIKE